MENESKVYKKVVDEYRPTELIWDQEEKRFTYKKKNKNKHRVKVFYWDSNDNQYREITFHLKGDIKNESTTVTYSSSGGKLKKIKGWVLLPPGEERMKYIDAAEKWFDPKVQDQRNEKLAQGICAAVSMIPGTQEQKK